MCAVIWWEPSAVVEEYTEQPQSGNSLDSRMQEGGSQPDEWQDKEVHDIKALDFIPPPPPFFFKRLYRQSWPVSLDRLASAWVLGLKVYVTIPRSSIFHTEHCRSLHWLLMACCACIRLYPCKAQDGREILRNWERCDSDELLVAVVVLRRIPSRVTTGCRSVKGLVWNCMHLISGGRSRQISLTSCEVQACLFLQSEFYNKLNYSETLYQKSQKQQSNELRNFSGQRLDLPFTEKNRLPDQFHI
jgi:hypothetical protein